MLTRLVVLASNDYRPGNVRTPHSRLLEDFSILRVCLLYRYSPESIVDNSISATFNESCGMSKGEAVVMRCSGWPSPSCHRSNGPSKIDLRFIESSVNADNFIRMETRNN